MIVLLQFRWMDVPQSPTVPSVLLKPESWSHSAETLKPGENTLLKETNTLS